MILNKNNMPLYATGTKYSDSTLKSMTKDKLLEYQRLKELSKDYKKGLISIMQAIMPDENINIITKTFKNVERMV